MEQTARREHEFVTEIVSHRAGRWRYAMVNGGSRGAHASGTFRPVSRVIPEAEAVTWLLVWGEKTAADVRFCSYVASRQIGDFDTVWTVTEGARVFRGYANGGRCGAFSEYHSRVVAA